MTMIIMININIILSSSSSTLLYFTLLYFTVLYSSLPLLHSPYSLFLYLYLYPYLRLYLYLYLRRLFGARAHSHKQSQ